MKKVLMLAKEFRHGDYTSDYCKNLAEFLTLQGFEVNLVCFGDAEGKTLEHNFWVHRVPLKIHGDSFFNWMMLVNNELKGKGREIFEESEFDLIHGNCWLTSPAATILSKFSGKPLVMSIHSTEQERGFGSAHSRVISDIEWMACYEASHVIVDNGGTYGSLKNDLGVPEGKISQVDISKFGWQSKVLDIYEKVLRDKKASGSEKGSERALQTEVNKQ